MSILGQVFRDFIDRLNTWVVLNGNGQQLSEALVMDKVPNCANMITQFFGK